MIDPAMKMKRLTPTRLLEGLDDNPNSRGQTPLATGGSRAFDKKLKAG